MQNLVLWDVQKSPQFSRFTSVCVKGCTEGSLVVPRSCVFLCIVVLAFIQLCSELSSHRGYDRHGNFLWTFFFSACNDCTANIFKDFKTQELEVLGGFSELHKTLCIHIKSFKKWCWWFFKLSEDLRRTSLDLQKLGGPVWSHFQRFQDHRFKQLYLHTSYSDVSALCRGLEENPNC